MAPQHRLTCPAKGRDCAHVACCNYEQLRSLVATSTHSRKPDCPVTGCTVKLRLEKDLEKDLALEAALIAGNEVLVESLIEFNAEAALVFPEVLFVHSKNA